MSLEDKSLAVILSVMNNKTSTEIEKLVDALDTDVIRSLHKALDKHKDKVGKWTFYIFQLQDYESWRKFNETTVYADSIEEAMSKLAYIWNNGGNPEGEAGDYEDDYFLSELIDEKDEIVRITPEELQKIIFVTGKYDIEPYFTGRTDSSAAADHTRIEIDMPHKFYHELKSMYKVAFSRDITI